MHGAHRIKVLISLSEVHRTWCRLNHTNHLQQLRVLQQCLHQVLMAAVVELLTQPPVVACSATGWALYVARGYPLQQVVPSSRLQHLVLDMTLPCWKA
jgi:hypothetical protein